jgi:hypothetical protein
MHFFCKDTVDFPYSCSEFSLHAQTVQTLHSPATCSGFHLFGGTGGGFFVMIQLEQKVAICSGFHLSGGTGGRPPDMALLCMITTDF